MVNVLNGPEYDLSESFNLVGKVEEIVVSGSRGDSLKGEILSLKERPALLISGFPLLPLLFWTPVL